MSWIFRPMAFGALAGYEFPAKSMHGPDLLPTVQKPDCWHHSCPQVMAKLAFNEIRQPPHHLLGAALKE